MQLMHMMEEGALMHMMEEGARDVWSCMLWRQPGTVTPILLRIGLGGTGIL
jgi:hypothetical protein